VSEWIPKWESDRDFELSWNGRFGEGDFRLSPEEGNAMLYDSKSNESRWPLPFRQQSWGTIIALAFVIVLVGIISANLPSAWMTERNGSSAASSQTAH
jgi:hypothetical protein